MPATNELLERGQYQFDRKSDSSATVGNPPDGDSIAQLLKRNNRPFPLAEVIGWADRLLDELHSFHTGSPPIIHKRIRPEYLILNSDGSLELAGFDAAGDELDPDAAFCYAPLEQVWENLDPASQKVIINSFDERSERILKEPADARSDVYSLGAALYCMMTAREPVSALERSIEVIDGKADPLKEPTKIDPSIAPEISDVVMKAMELRRENRFDSAAIMRQVLTTAQARARAREEAEARELEEAAEDLKMAEQMRLEQVRRIVEQKRLEMEAEQRRQAEKSERKLKEAEQQRLLAEQHAAEAERLLNEEAAQAAAVEPEDEILELDLTNEVAAVAEKQTQGATRSTAPQEDLDESQDELKPSAAAPELEAPKTMAAAAAASDASAGETTDDYTFNIEQPKKSGFGLPAIIAAAVVVLTLAGGGFWMISSGSKQQSQSAAPVQNQERQAPPETHSAPVALPATAAPENQQGVADAAPSAPETAPAEPARATAVPEKSRKPAAQPQAAKSPAKEKKPVTADDLINDLN